MNINSKDSDKKYCSKCSIELTVDNWFKCHKERNNYICKKCSKDMSNMYYKTHKEQSSQYHKEYYQNNREIIKERIREYQMTNGLYVDIEGKQIFISGVRRERPSDGLCEMCRKRKFEDYHHWDNTNIKLAMWLCSKCHPIAEIAERFKRHKVQVRHYLSLKKIIIKNQ